MVHALRTLRKSPGFVVVAIGTLALGIGANTAIFSLIDQTLYRALPGINTDGLVLFHSEGGAPGHSSSDNGETVWSQPIFQDFRTRTDVFEKVAARTSGAVSVSWRGNADRARAEIVSGSFFETVGLRAYRGRVFTDADDRVQGGHPVAMLTYAYWQRRFGGSLEVLNQAILINGHPMEVVGILPEGFHGVVRGSVHEVFVPLAMQKQITPALDGHGQRRVMHLTILARLKPGIGAKQAEAAILPFYRGILEEEAKEGRFSAKTTRQFTSKTIELRPAGQGVNDLREELEAPMLALMAMVGLVLVMTCSNLANLLIVRAAGRSREIAVRLAVGANRWDLIKQLLSESLLLGLAGGGLGLLVANWTVDALVRTLGDEAEFLTSQLDLRILAFNFVVAVAASLLFGLLPALTASGVDIADSIRDQSAGAGLSRSHVNFRRAMVGGQVALSALLLVGAGLFVRSLANVRNVNPGFRTASILTFSVNPSLNGYTRERGEQFYRELEARLQALPAVESVGSAQLRLLDNSNRATNITVEGRPYREDEEDTDSHQNYVSAGFLPTLEVPMVAGRVFTTQDLQSPNKTVVVNEAFVERFFPGQNPVGKRIAFGGGTKVVPDREIIGVVRNARHGEMREKQKRMVFVPYTQDRQLYGQTYYLRTRGDAGALTNAARTVVAEMDPALPVYRAESLELRIDQSLAGERLLAILAGSFGALACLLAGLGLYGMLSYSVTNRTRELGLRMALGASAGNVLGLVLRQAGWIVGIGLIAGLAGGVAMGRLLESSLFGLRSSDPLVLGAAGGILAVVALLSASLPARKAIRVDPLTALRHD